LKISVTQEHIDNGVRGNCEKDPIALAMIDAKWMRPWVGPLTIRTDGFNGGCMRQSFETPEIVWKFLSDFDNGRPVEPFEFEVEE
jgi:hypothetical protein